MVKLQLPLVHVEPPIGGSRPAYPQTDGHQSCGITCAQTAIIPTNSVMDASAAASSTNILNIYRSCELEHMRNIVPFSFFSSRRKIQPQTIALTNGLSAKAGGIRDGELTGTGRPVFCGRESAY